MDGRELSFITSGLVVLRLRLCLSVEAGGAELVVLLLARGGVVLAYWTRPDRAVPIFALQNSALAATEGPYRMAEGDPGDIEGLAGDQRLSPVQTGISTSFVAAPCTETEGFVCWAGGWIAEMSMLDFDPDFAAESISKVDLFVESSMNALIVGSSPAVAICLRLSSTRLRSFS